MGKIESRMVVVAVRAGKRPVDVLEMTYSQHALIGSGGYNPEDVQTSLDAGMNGHISKPLNVAEVAKAIARNLNKS